MKIKLILITLLCAFLVTSCSSSKRQVSCKTKPLKHKKYSVKQSKKKRKTYSVARSSSPKPVQNPGQTPEPVQQEVKIEPEVIQEPTIEPEIIVEPQLEPIIETIEPEEEIIEVEEEVEVEMPKPVQEEPISIADTKVGMPTFEDDLEDVVNELEKDEEFSFDKEIFFIDQSDLFQDRAKAINNISELAKVLKQNSDLFVTIVGNTATEVPDGEIIYGDSLPVYSQSGILNNKSVTIYDVMIARANRVRELLLSEGVSKNQMRHKAGSHRKYAKDRVVTFILKRQ